jgi:hypothetical protein
MNAFMPVVTPILDTSAASGDLNILLKLAK